MDQLFTKQTNGIELCHAAADDGDWAEVVPETLHLLKAYLKTDQFVVLVDESLPEDVVAWIFDAFETGEGHTVDEGCLLELGPLSGHTGGFVQRRSDIPVFRPIRRTKGDRCAVGKYSGL